ncbi:MAG TPA: hypothetical protein V6D50_06315 [Chroococcales cyanobacterium]
MQLADDLQLNAIGVAEMLGAIAWLLLGARSLNSQQPHSLNKHAAVKIFCRSISQQAGLLVERNNP